MLSLQACSRVSTTIYHGAQSIDPHATVIYKPLSCSWYKRSEFGIRAAIFFSAASVSGAFGGLLAVRIPVTESGAKLLPRISD